MTDPIGRRTGMDDDSGNTAWSYDARGRMVQETKSILGHAPFTTLWGYDNADRATSMTYPSGEVVTTAYLPQGLPDTLSGDALYLADSAYDASGRPVQSLLSPAGTLDKYKRRAMGWKVA